MYQAFCWAHGLGLRDPLDQPLTRIRCQGSGHPSEVRCYDGAGRLPSEADVLTELTTGLEERRPMSISDASQSLAQDAPRSTYWGEN